MRNLVAGAVLACSVIGSMAATHPATKTDPLIERGRYLVGSGTAMTALRLDGVNRTGPFRLHAG